MRTRPFLQRITWRHLLDMVTAESVPIEPAGARYVPRDARERAQLHDRVRGISACWPIPLTPCGTRG